MLFRPDIKLDRITEITPEMLKKRDIKALLLDVDNTMSTHHGEVLTDGLLEWIALMQENGFKLIVVSNSKEARVAPFAGRLGLGYISLACKPLPGGYFKGAKLAGVKRKNAAIVGDQMFTDVLGGKLSGVKTIWLTLIKPEPMWSFRLRRWLEGKIIKLFKIEKTEE